MELSSDTIANLSATTKSRTKGNRTTTLESLLGVVGLLYAKNRDQFQFYYELATSDEEGASVWYYITRKQGKSKNDCTKCNKQHS